MSLSVIALFLKSLIRERIVRKPIATYLLQVDHQWFENVSGYLNKYRESLSYFDSQTIGVPTNLFSEFGGVGVHNRLYGVLGGHGII